MSNMLLRLYLLMELGPPAAYIPLELCCFSKPFLFPSYELRCFDPKCGDIPLPKWFM